jgi:tetratricopeptide (TPR) repeat protein
VPGPADERSDLSWAAPDGTAAFVGRRRELSLGRAARRRAAAGERVLLLVTGEPGIGKTRLTAELAHEFDAEGDLVLHGRWDEEPLCPYQAFREALGRYAQRAPRGVVRGDIGALASSVARIVPEVVEADAGRPDHGADVVGEGDGDRYRAFDAVRRWIDTIAARRRLVLVLDDMHWADRPSLLLLEYLLRATTAPAQVLVVVTYRPTEAHARSWFSEFLAGVRRNADVENIALSGLSPAETRELVEAALGRTLSADEAAGTVTLQRHTGGNPFFLREVVRDLREAGRSLEAWATTDADALHLPAGLRDVVHWRLRQLSGVCMGVLSAASAVGEEFDIATVRRAVDGDEETLLTALDEARQAGVVVESARPPATHRFTHAVVRQALYEDLGSARRARLHLRLATTLEARYGDDAVHHAGELARHFYLGAAAGGVDDALRYLRLAADDALQHVAYEAAVDHLTRALDIVTIHRPGDAVERCRLLLAIGAADVKAGRSAEADHRFLDAFAVADRCRWPDLLAEAALGYGGVLPAGSDPDPGARALLESALAALPDEDGRAQALVLGRLAQLGHFERPRAERVRLAGDGVAMARRLGQRSTLAAVLGYRYWALDGPDDTAGQIGVALEIRALGEEIGDREIVLHGLKCELHSRLEVGDFDASVRVATALGSLAAEVQQPEYLRLQCMWDSLVAGIEGRYADAEERAAEAIAILERTEHPQLYALYVGLSLPWRWLQGRMEELRPVLQLGVTGRTSPAETALVAWVASELGEVEQARALLDAMAPDDIADDDRNFHWWLLMVGLVRTSLNLVDRRWAAALYDIIEPYAEHNCRTGQATFLGAAAMHLGTLALVVGRDADAVRHLDAALARHRAMAARPLACVTARMLDAALRRRSGPGDVVRAEDLGRHASAEAAALGISLPAVPPAPVGGD